MLDTVMNRALASGLNRATAGVLLLSLVLSLLHHIDHALRVDHSGWPFKDAFTPFTYSLLAYPVVLFALFGAQRLYWLRWLLLAGAAGFVVFAHTVIESPATQFHMWAHNESAHAANIHNALNLESTVLAYLSVIVGMTLNVVAVLAMVMMLWNGLQARQQPRTP